MANQRRPRVEVHKDRRKLTITFPGEWFGAASDLALDVVTPDLDVFIATLGRAREAMLERPPMDHSETVPHGTLDPRWNVAKQKGTGDPALSLRHEGFGWVHFGLPKQEAVKLGQALLLQAADPAPLN